MRLTETEIKTFKPDPHRERWENDGAGLYLRILRTGRMSWVWRTKSKRHGKTSYVTLGEWPALSVKQARAELAKRKGRKTPVNAFLVRDALTEWYAEVIEPSYKVTKNVRVYVDRAIAEFGSRRLQELTRAEIARFMRNYGKVAPVAANRCLSTLKVALNWCVEAGYLEASPADKLTRRVAGGAEATRERVLTDHEIGALFAWQSPNAPLLRFLLATGLRIQEAQRAGVEHIVGDRLIVPKEHSKNGRAHWVYLTPLARAQIEPQAAPRLFRSISPTGVQAALKRWQGVSKPHRWTPHDLRRTFATRLGDLGIGPHVIEKCLNHTAQGVGAVYNRAELEHERIAAARKWAGELLEFFPDFVGPPGRLYRRAQARHPRG